MAHDLNWSHAVAGALCAGAGVVFGYTWAKRSTNPTPEAKTQPGGHRALLCFSGGKWPSGSKRETTSSCKCQGVKLRISGDASDPHRGASLCYCESCRKQHATPLYMALYVAPKYVEILQGQELIQDGTRSDKPRFKLVRCFCKVCGSPIMNRINTLPDDKPMIGVFPGQFDTPMHELAPDWQPSRHVNCEEAFVLSPFLFNDSLPKHTTHRESPEFVPSKI